MNIIFKIAKNEWRNLFYSPVAWFLTVIFLVQCAFYYTDLMLPIANAQDIFKANDPNFRGWGDINSFTRNFFSDGGGVFDQVLRNLYLFVPLLTMGIISREVNNGTIKLLYSSPVTLRQIVVGKYLALVGYNVMLLMTMGIFMITAVFTQNTVEYGIFFSGLLGFTLLMSAYAAIGFFMSSLSTYAVVSAISSFTIFFILGNINGLWQQYDFIRDLTWFLSMSGKAMKMLRGLITTRDLLYFVLIIYMFLSFTLIKLKSARESRPWYVNAMRYITVLVITLAAGYISSRPIFVKYLDVTRTKTNTLHPRGQEIIAALGSEPLEITLYTNLLADDASKSLPYTRNFYLDYLWEKYVRFKPDISFRFEYFYDYDSTIMGPALGRRYPNKDVKEIAQAVADLYNVNLDDFMPPAEIRKRVDLRPEYFRSIIQLKYRGKTEWVRTFPDAEFWPDEPHIAASLQRLTEPAPKLVSITGELERSPWKSGERELGNTLAEKRSRFTLINHGFDIDSVSLDHRDIPSDASIVLLSDPRVQLTATARQKLQDYLESGRDMFLLGEPGKEGILNPVLKPLGVTMLPGTLVQTSRHEMPQMITPSITDTGLYLADDENLITVRQKRESGKKDSTLDYFGEDSLAILMPGATGLMYSPDSEFEIEPLAISQNNGWLKAGRLVTDSIAPVFDNSEGDINGSFATALMLKRNIHHRQQRLVVCSDADFTSNLRQNFSFFSFAIYSWLNGNRFPVYQPRRPYLDYELTVTAPVAAALKIAYVWVIPGAIVLLGSIVLLRRKRK